MKSRIPAVLALALVAGLASRCAPKTAAASPYAAEPPRLVLLVAVDQMRYDYLPRFASGFTAGGLDFRSTVQLPPFGPVTLKAYSTPMAFAFAAFSASPLGRRTPNISLAELPMSISS